MTLPTALATRLEKAAVDNGFDLELPCVNDWLGFGSSHAPLQVWLASDGDGHLLAALSRRDVANALADHGAMVAAALPPDAAAARSVLDIPALHRLLRRAYQLARTLPDELLQKFEQKTSAMPRSTEAERLVVQRVGQDLFRAGLMEYWDSRCAITGIAVPQLLRASHIKPWADCATDRERLDIFNGLLLAPHLDAAFDLGFITVGDDRIVIASPLLAEEDRRLLGLHEGLRVGRLAAGHRAYLVWHRERVFAKRGSTQG